MGAVALSFASTKNAALYYDTVHTPHVVSLLMHDVSGLSEFERTLDALKTLWPDRSYNALDHFRFFLPRSLVFACDIVAQDPSLLDHDAGLASLVSLSYQYVGILFPDKNGEMLTKDEWHAFRVTDDNVFAIVDGICKCSPAIRERILYDDRLMPGIRSTVSQHASKAEALGLQVDFCLPAGRYEHTGRSRPMAVLAGLPIIDAASSTWEQVFAIREDPEAAKKLRRLRVFTRKHFAGKTLASIEDEFYELMDDYQTTADRYDFKIKTHHLGVMLTAATASAPSLIAAIAGNPNPLNALVPGFAFAFAGLEMYRYDAQAKWPVDDHAAAYIFDAKRQIGNDGQPTSSPSR